MNGSIYASLRWLGLVTGCFVALSSQADPGGATWRYTTGFDMSSGDYGEDQDTDITYVPFGVSRQSGSWTLKATVPWTSVDGSGVVGGGDSVIVIPGGEAFDESGLGDTWVSATYSVPSFPAELGFLDVVGKLKIPTADKDKGLGTGEVDYTMQADYFKPMGDWTPMVSVAYKVKNDPEGVELDNVLYASVGTAYRLSTSSSVGAMIDFQEASAAGADDAQELFAYWSQGLSSSWKLMLYGYTGFSDGSPDHGFGMQLSYRQQ